MKFHTVSCIAVLVLLLISCAGIPESDFSDLTGTDSYSRRIESFLEEGDSLRAIPLMQAWKKASGKNHDLYQTVIDRIKTDWHTAREDGDWKRAIAYLRSFQILSDFAHLIDVTEVDLFVQGAMDYIESSRIGAAAALIQANINPDNLDDETRKELAGVFSDAGYTSLSAMLRSEPIPESPGMEPLIDGTITVWVNRGLRVEGNVGVPDRGIGSGFFIDSNGYLLTNYHVIESEVNPSYKGYSRLFIKTDEESGDRIPARVVGWDKNFDLALLKTEMDVPYVFSFANQKMPELGDRISAIGSPGGLAKTLTSGTVSAFARSVQPLAGSLQIDVPINPGNSGGPLLNNNGEVIGIVFAGITDFEGVNFAIPGQYAQSLIPALYEGGQIELPWLGVSAWDNSGEIDVVYVVPHTPAADTGLLPGDTIKSINGQSLVSIRHVQEYMITCIPGTLATIEWERDGEVHQAVAYLDVRPEIPLKEALSMDAREHLLAPLFGFTVERIDGWGLRQKYRIVSVLQGSISDEIGFSAGDAISLKRWRYVKEYDAVLIQLDLKGRKAGFLESDVKLGSYLNINTVF